MRRTPPQQMEHHLDEIDRFLSYAELSTTGPVVLLSSRDFKRIGEHLKKAQKLLPFLGRWGA